MMMAKRLKLIWTKENIMDRHKILLPWRFACYSVAVPRAWLVGSLRLTGRLRLTRKYNDHAPKATQAISKDWSIFNPDILIWLDMQSQLDGERGMRAIRAMNLKAAGETRTDAAAANHLAQGLLFGAAINAAISPREINVHCYGC